MWYVCIQVYVCAYTIYKPKFNIKYLLCWSLPYLGGQGLSLHTGLTIWLVSECRDLPVSLSLALAEQEILGGKWRSELGLDAYTVGILLGHSLSS